MTRMTGPDCAVTCNLINIHTYIHTYVRYNIPTVIYELYGRSRITGLLYSIFGLRVPDDGTVTFYREIKLKMGFCVVHCCYYDKIYLQLIDMGGLRLQRAIQTDIQTVMEAGVKYFQHQYVKTRGIKYIKQKV